jgi:hypothetical protein
VGSLAHAPRRRPTGRPGGSPRWLVALGAVTYALVPVTSGAWGDGRLGVVVAAVLVPWIAHAALGFSDPEPDRRWRAAWRTGLLLAVAAAFTPWPGSSRSVLAVVFTALAVAVTAACRATAPSGAAPGGLA